jgi:hypothetical protein
MNRWKTIEEKKVRTITIFELLLTWIVSVSIIGIILLVFNVFNSINSLIMGTILLIGIYRIFKFRIELKEVNTGLLLILLIALLFRARPYLWVMGGQDQGLYVNMSSYYENYGTTFVKDNVRETLYDTEKTEYDRIHQKMNYKSNKDLKGLYPTNPDSSKKLTNHAHHLPGVYIKDLSKSEYVFQFYPLHPLWMSMFGKLFGSSNRVYSLVFFSLLTIILFYLIAFELSGNNKAGYLVAFFLSINPLHSFFSKFPVSEIVALFFSSGGFYCLIKFYNQRKKEINVFYLYLSAGLFLCLFFTRISGFMYMPFFYILLLLIITQPWNEDNKILLKYIMIYSIFIIILFSLSLWYGMVYSYAYSVDIYRIFPKLLGTHWLIILLLFLFSFIIFPFIIIILKNYLKEKTIKSIILKSTSPLFNILSISLFLIILFGFIRAIQFLNEGQLEAFNSSSTVVCISYLSLFGFILFLPALNKIRRERNILYGSLVFFLIIFWFINTIMRQSIPYQYYYARYLLNEIIPYSFLLISLYLGDMYEKRSFHRNIAVIFIVAICIYSLYFTLQQFKGSEADGAAESLERIERHLDEKDLIFITFNDAQIITSLKYYYNLNTFYIDDFNKIPDNLLLTITDKFNDLYVLSTIPVTNETFTFIDNIAYKHGVFEHTHKIPVNFGYERKDLFLYRVNRNNYFNLTKTLNLSYADLINFHDDRIWTNGNGVIKATYTVKPDDRHLVLNTLYTTGLSGAKLKILINKKELKFHHQSNNSFYFELDKTIKEINEIQILSPAFNPKKAGINDDDRDFGIDVDSIKIVGADEDIL